MSNKSSTTWIRLLLPFVILISPFVIFLDQHAYGFASLEFFLALGGLLVFALLSSLIMIFGGSSLGRLVLVALIIFFIDVQFDWLDQSGRYTKAGLGLGLIGLTWTLGTNCERITAAIFSTMFVVTLVQIDFSKDVKNVRFTGKMKSSATQSRRLIHIIFDEHIGLDGIPTDMEEGKNVKKSVKRFYEKNGFRAFGGAFSRYVDTVNSITNTLNFAAKNRNRSFIDDENALEISHNSYFDLLIAQGYRVNVLQTTYLDLCRNDSITNCFQYDWGLRALRSITTSTLQKLLLIYASFAEQSYIFRRVRSSYCASQDRPDCVQPSDIQRIKQASFRKGIPVNTSIWGKPIEFHSLSTLQLLDGLWEDILNMPPGNVVFAHLLFPHGPFITNADCSIKRPIEQWKDRSLRGSEVSRKEHYRHYLHQLECLYTKLDELIERMRAAEIYDDSIIIFQGDHGSRIYITNPSPKYQNRLTKQDFSDAYSTLFAVKVPGLEPRYDTTARPLEQLLADFMSGCFDMDPKCPDKDSPAFVYLYEETERKDLAEFLQVPYLAANR